MKILRREIEHYLEVQPLARERKNKDRAIVNVLLARYPQFRALDKKDLVTFVQQHSSMDRSWRKILEERPELRGDDYREKNELEEDVKKQLGYDV